MNTFPVRGYFHPEEAFATIAEWEQVANQFLELEKEGFDTRGGVIDDNHNLVQLINKWFKYQLYVETQHFDGLTQKEVLDFIEDFVNHRVWQMRDEFNELIGTELIDKVKIAFFYSRGALEPFVLLDADFTNTVYGTTDAVVTTLHWASPQGVLNLKDSIENGGVYAISTFTKQFKKFFRPESNVLVKLQGKLVAAFKSDVKSIVTDKGNKAAAMFRLGFPGEQSNLCTSVEECNDEDRSTYLWNEIIIKPVEILEEKKVIKY